MSFVVFTELTRRQALTAGAFGSLPARRIDQLVAPASAGLPPPPPSNLIVARRVVVTGPGEGLLSYFPTIARGNLLASEGIAAGFNDGTPGGGNLILQGDTVYGNNGTSFWALNIVGGSAAPPSITWLTASNPAGPYSGASSIIEMLASGQLQIQAGSGQVINLLSPLTLLSGAAENTSGGWSGGPEIGKGNTPNVTNNAAGFPNMLGATITTPSADLSVTGGWRLSEWGHGTWGSTLQTLSMSLIISGGTGPSITVPTADQVISTAFTYLLEGQIMPQTLGAAGTFTAWLKLTFQTAGSNPLILFAETTGLAINTTAAVGWLQQSHWASATGTPTITSDGFTFEKVSL